MPSWMRWYRETRAPTLEQLKRLPYTMQTIRRDVAALPAQPRPTARSNHRPRPWAVYSCTPGTYLLVFPYATHRHPDFWEEPERFDPDQFSAGARGGSPSLRLLPVRGRPEDLHRQQLCDARSTHPHGSARAPVQRAARRRSQAPDRNGRHVDGSQRSTHAAHTALSTRDPASAL